MTLRHNDMCREWHELCATALTPAAVTDEPEIPLGQPAVGAGASATPADLSIATRGDVGVHGFWTRGATAIFDVRVTDVDAASNVRIAPARVLARQEKEKKQKYLPACQGPSRSFTPLVFSTDGMLGKEAKSASRRLASLLAGKWKRPFSQMCGFVRSRQSIALVRSTSLLLRGARNSLPRSRGPVWDNVAGLALYR